MQKVSKPIWHNETEDTDRTVNTDFEPAHSEPERSTKKKTHRGRKGGKGQSLPFKPPTPLAKEQQEAAAAASNSKKKDSARMHGQWGSDDEPDVEDNQQMNQDFIHALVPAVTEDMQMKLSMAPGGALTAQSPEFIQEAAAGAIAEQVKLLQDSSVKSCDNIIATLAADIDRHNEKLISEQRVKAFINAVMILLEKVVDSLNAIGAMSPRQSGKKQSDEGQSDH